MKDKATERLTELREQISKDYDGNILKASGADQKALIRAFKRWQERGRQVIIKSNATPTINRNLLKKKTDIIL